jgi:hypothetical protein
MPGGALDRISDFCGRVRRQHMGPVQFEESSEGYPERVRVDD